MDTNKQEAYDMLISYVDRFIPGMEQVATDYRGGKEATALKAFADGVEGLIWITTAVSVCQDMFKEPISLEEINPILVELSDALEARDYVLVCDLIEYEVVPIVKEWKKKM